MHRLQDAGRNPGKAARLISQDRSPAPSAAREGRDGYRTDAPSREPSLPYKGRFAPSPTGSLHFGSLLAAVASFLDARHHGGTWLVRIENLDPPREKPGSADEILRTLEAFGFEWDGPVVRQSTRSEAYADVVGQLLRNGLAYPCNCSRKDIATAGLAGIEGPVYPGTCRTAGAKLKRQRAVRLLTHDEPIAFADRVFGHQVQQVESSVGDFVLKRADGLFAYQLAVVVDDAWQGITHVVRGADLLASTPRQIHLQQLLGLARPSYAHIPLAIDAAGRKLSKTDAAHPLDACRPREALVQALSFLGQPIPETGRMSDFWAEAAVRWNAEAVPRHPG